jgi:glycosyltransferase involved in cell wall biosynthesis
LRREIKQFDPTFICGQNTADAEILFFATMGTKYRYSFFMPSTMFRFPDEGLKYTRRFYPKFHKAWEIIPGHKQFVPESAPARDILRRLVNELRAVIQYRAVNKAEYMLMLTNQMGKESKILYDRDYTIIKAGLSKELFSHVQKHDIKKKLGLEGKTMILNINRLDVRKRIDMAIRGFKELLEEFPDAYFVIGGRGAEKQNLENLAGGLGIADRVKMIGFVPEDELYDHFMAADVFIHLDWADFDLAVLEGLALGKKVIASSEVESEGTLAQLNDTRLFRAYPSVTDVHETLVAALRSEVEPSVPVAEALKDYTWESYTENLLKIIRHD